ncbi:MAG: SDR family NAD(P)-dependent oxidoreductase, partial [Alphaproteobacteria bacterium]
MPRLFCFGLGYTARALATALAARGWRIAGTARDAASRAALAAAGYTMVRFDRDHPLADPAASLAGVTHILSSVPPDADGDPVLDVHGADIAALGGIEWAGYLSTTGVYGDYGGAEV